MIPDICYAILFLLLFFCLRAGREHLTGHSSTWSIMIDFVLPFVKGTALFSAGIFGLCFIFNRIAGYRIRKAGGVRAPVLANNLYDGIRVYWDAGSRQFQGSVVEFCSNALDNTSIGKRDCAELSLTGLKRVVISRDPEQIKTVLATKFHDFGHGPMWSQLWRPFLGDGIFAVDGDAWHTSRGMIRPMFIKDRVSDLNIFEGCTEKLLSKLPSPGDTVDIKELFYRWSLDSATEFLLGESVGSLDNPLNELASALTLVQQKQALIFVLNPIASFVPKGDYLAGIKVLEAFIEPIIQRAISLSEEELHEITKSDENFTFLHSIARETKDHKFIRDQILSILLAGRDTSAATLSWAIYELAAKPEIWSKLRKEVLKVVGTNERPDYQTLKDLAYVRYVINETLRLHPAVAINTRQALKTTTIPGDNGGPEITILKGDTVTIDTLGLHLREENYPSVSKEFAHHLQFSPDRWANWTPTPWTYIPFHGGPRICVGQNFAMTEMAYCLIRLAQTYERLEYRGDWHAQKLRAELIGTPALGVPVALFQGKQ